MKDNKKAKIIINPIGGLANRMRALASGITLARELNCDYMVVWYCNWELNARIEDIFEINEDLKKRVVYPSWLTYNFIYSIPRKKNFYITGLTSHFYFGEIMRDSYPEIRSFIHNDEYAKIKSMAMRSLAEGKNFLMQGGTELYTYSLDFYRNIFKPVKSIREKIEDITGMLGENYIGVHIRRTDNDMSIQHSPDTLFIIAMDDAIRSNPNVKFYLATDCEETKAKFRKLYGDRLIFNRSEADRGSTSGIIDAVTELYILSKAESIIGSYYSSFSETAAKLGGIPIFQVFKS